MSTPRGRKEARELLEQVLRLMPLAHPIRLIFSRAVGEDSYGDTDLLDEGKPTARFLIRIGRDVDNELLEGTLLHEYSHAVAWYWEDTHHGPSFGIAQARLWSLLHDGPGE
jgi:hypothetical protein